MDATLSRDQNTTAFESSFSQRTYSPNPLVFSREILAAIMSSTIASQIYLSQEAGDLVLKQGVNPKLGALADTCVLIVGGGVTGLTVGNVLRIPVNKC